MAKPQKKNDRRGELPLEGRAEMAGEGELDPGAELVRWLFPAYIFLILIGFFALRIDGVLPIGSDSPDRAVFTSVNAATLTGFQLSVHPTSFGAVGKFILLVLTLIGTSFSMIVGGLAVKRILRLDWADRRIYLAVGVLHLMAALLGLLLPTSGERTAFGGLFRGIAAMGNSGLYVDVPPGVREVTTHAVLLPLAVLGGLGVTVVIELWDAVMHRRPVSRHAQVVLRMTAGFYLAGLVGLTLLQMIGSDAPAGGRGPAGPTASVPWGTALVNASATSVNARTAGLAMLPVYNFPRAMTVFVMVLMVVGSSSGGTAGGLKTTTVYELFTGPSRALRGEAVSRTFGVAATWLLVYMLSAAVFYMLLLTTEPQIPGDRGLFVIVSAVSNVGLSHDTLSMTRSSLYVVSAAMFTGRLAPLLILWWMADTTRDAEVAVG